MPTERNSKKRQRVEAHDDNGKKQRGRPRVEGEDETAADVRVPPDVLEVHANPALEAKDADPTGAASLSAAQRVDDC